MSNTGIEYQAIREIMGQVEGVELKRGTGVFRFPMYVNRKMEETGIEALELSVRAYNCLKRAGYSSVAQLAEGISGTADLKRIRNCGTKSVEEIMERLFLFQYNELKPERRAAFLQRIIRMNME